jgi:hypothetical protein
VTVTSKDLGGEGSALGRTKQVTVWAAPGSEEKGSWRYDITIQHNAGEIEVIAMKSTGGGNHELITRQGSLVALDPPTPLEMLAAQARHFSDEGVEDHSPSLTGEDGAD